MITRAKTLGVVIGALLALSAFGAQAASAGKIMSLGNPDFGIEAVQVAGEEHKLVVDGGNTLCENVALDSSSFMSSPSSSFTVHPTYVECEAFGFLFATITTTGCDFLFTVGSQISTGVHNATMEVVCGTGKSIVITAGTCEAKIVGGTVINSGIRMENMPASNDLTIKFSSAPVAVFKTKDGFLCPFVGTGVAAGSYSGNETAIGRDENAAGVEITVEP